MYFSKKSIVEDKSSAQKKIVLMAQKYNGGKKQLAIQFVGNRVNKMCFLIHAFFSK